MPPTTLIQRAPAASVCNTASCLAASELVLSYVNFNVDPCSDFYQYTCGSWLQSPPIVEKFDNGMIYSLYAKAQDDGLRAIVGILDGTYDDIGKKLKTDTDGFHFEDQADTDRINFQFLKDYYNVCLNTDLSAQLGPTPIFADIALIQKELFPIDSTTTHLSLANTLAFFVRRGVPSSLITVDYEVNELDHAIRTAKFVAPVKSLNSFKDLTKALDMVWSIFGEPLADNGHAAFIHQESQKAGFTLWSKERVKAAAQNYIEISQKISSAASERVGDTGLAYITINDVDAEHPFIGWSSLLDNLSGTKYSQPQTLVRVEAGYIQRLGAVLSKISTEAMQDFFIVDFMSQQYSYLQLTDNSPVKLSAQQEASALHKSSKILTRRAPNPDAARSELCADDISRSFPDAIGRYYTLATFGASKEKQRLQDFVSQMHNSWLNHIPDTPWLDKETATKAYQKIKLLKTKIGFKTSDPDWREPNSIKSYYDGIVVDKRGYYYAKAATNVWKNDKKWKRLPLPITEIEWSETYYPNEANALYTRLGNDIEIGAGIAQSPFYDITFPEYLNYGGLGATIGHELVHGLDDNGRLFNGTGYIVNWWSNYSINGFESEAQCFVNEYSQYSIIDNQGNSSPVDGTTTLGENIADAGGLSIAFNAYQEMVKEKWPGQSEAVLPGPEFSNLTPEQLLFISYGISFCETDPRQPSGYYNGESHTLSKLRTNLPLQNLVQFSATFNCPVGSPMNPHKTDEDRCKLW